MARDEIEALAAIAGVALTEVGRLARLLVLNEIDPIKATGEPFLFQSQSKRANADPEGLELSWFNVEIPEPNAQVDLLVAFEEFERDCQRWAWLIGDYVRKPSAEGVVLLRRISLAQLAWFRFFAVRHPRVAMREMFAADAENLAAEIADNAERAQRHLDRQLAVVEGGRA